MTPAGRWVARIRCRPRDRPRGGDVHDAVDELGHLGGQRGELVHDDDQVRRGLRVAASRWSASRSLAFFRFSRCSR